jgi:cell division protein FtsB
MKRIALAVVLITVIALFTVTWHVHNQISDLQNQVDDLQAQNSELQDQNSGLEEQISELQLQNREKQDRLADLTYQLAFERHLSVKITSFAWDGGFYPIVGLTLSHPITVTVLNDAVIPLSGLTLSFALIDKDRGTPIGSSVPTQIDRLNAEESREIGGAVYTTIGTSLDNAVCVVTLTAGDITLDKGTYSLS